MFRPDHDPVAGSLLASSLFAALPVLVMFVMLGGLRIRAHVCAAAGLLTALTVAVGVYAMPLGQALDAGLLGFVYGMFPIMWIVWNAIWIYNLTVESGHFGVLRRSVASFSSDLRIQAVLIAFCFGALIEALGGFGTPVAITSVMLVAVGFPPFRAAAVALVANTAPVAFGSIGIPVITLSGVTGIPVDDLGAMVGRQTPVLALFVPFILVGMVDGRRGVRQTWPAALVGGLGFALAQFACSNYFSVELTDIAAALVGAAAVVGLLRVWQPTEVVTATEAEGTGPADTEPGTVLVAERRDTRRDVFTAYAPYLLIIVTFSLAQWDPVQNRLNDLGTRFAWPGLHVANADGEPVSTTTFNLNITSASGTILLLCGLITAAMVGVRPERAVRAYGRSLHQLRWATLTVGLVLALAYVLNLSGQTTTLGLWIAGAGGLLGVLSPVIGWIGVTVTGSDTSSNSLFGSLQVSAAKEAGLSQTLLAAANSSGGVLGKMLSPQNLAIAVAAAGLKGQEGDLFRAVLKWSGLLLAVMCLLVYLQTTPVLSWAVV